MAHSDAALVGAVIDTGIDGFITHRNMFGQCGCAHCSAKFRQGLAAQYDAGQLQAHFGIANLAMHKLPLLQGFHREHAQVPTALELEGMKFARRQTKDCFDEIFLKFGRGRKKIC